MNKYHFDSIANIKHFLIDIGIVTGIIIGWVPCLETLCSLAN